MPMLRHVLLATLVALALVQAPSLAQTPSVQQQNAAATAFDQSLQRLSEILGALHYLRNICGANEGLKWRDEMAALVAAEAQAADRKARMTAAFNRGYRGFQQNYSTCTPAADMVIRRYLDEGSKIARDLTARYAN
jgi:uncharacterized protein (TIGR02301 family)